MDYGAPPTDGALSLSAMMHGTPMVSSKFTMHHQETRLMHDKNQLTEDASCTTKALLENVQTVYMQNMSASDEIEKVMRGKMQSDAQVQRLQEQVAKLSGQLAEEEQWRTTEVTVRSPAVAVWCAQAPACTFVQPWAQAS